MKPIQILAFMAAIGVAASAQNTKGAPAPSQPGVHAATVKTAEVGPKPGAGPKGPVLVVKPVAKPVPKGSKAMAAAPQPKKPTVADTNKVKLVPLNAAPSTAKEKPAAEEPPVTASGRRDPFLSIIRNIPAAASGPNCSVGKRCLFIPELELKGIAKDTDGQMLAVVVSTSRRAYFLRENDQVFNGSVQRITGDSIVFREFATDRLGRETAHEVVKRIPKT